MGYRIVYGPEKPGRGAEHSRVARGRVLAAALLLAAVLGVKCAWGGVHRDAPSSPALGALQALTERVRDGEPVGEAVMTFCRDVLESAQQK